MWYSDYGSIGAYDIYIGSPDILTVTSANDVIGEAGLSLREAILLAKGKTRIEFANSLAGQTITIATAFEVNKAITIDALSLYDWQNDKPGLTIYVSNTSVSRHFCLFESAFVSLTGLNMTNGHLFGDSGASIYLDSGTLLLNYCQISNCLTPGNGGAIYSYGGSLSINQCQFMDCNSFKSGGALYAFNSTTKIYSSTFKNCHSKDPGGAIYNSHHSLSVENSEINSCSSEGSGGGVSNYEGNVELTGTTITLCIAGTSGGGLNNYNGTMIVKSCILSYNTASVSSISYTGGGIYSQSNSLTVHQTKFIGNKAYSGGGLYVYGGTADIRDSAFWGNSSNNTGGAISFFGAKGKPNVTMVNLTVAGNTSQYGGGMCLYSQGIFNLYNSIIAENRSTFQSNYNDLYTDFVFTNAANNLLMVDNVGFVCRPVFDSQKFLANFNTIDLSLTLDSIACDAGDNRYVTTSVDLAGHSRIMALPGSSNVTVDIGTWETISVNPEYSVCFSSTQIFFENEQVIKFQLSAYFSEEVKIKYWRLYWGETDSTGNKIFDQMNVTSDTIYIAHYYKNSSPQNFSISVEIVDSNYYGMGQTFYLGSWYASGQRNRPTVSAMLPESNSGKNINTELALRALNSVANSNLDEVLIEELSRGQISSGLISAAALPMVSGSIAGDHESQFQDTIRVLYAGDLSNVTRKSSWGDWWALSSSQSARSSLRTDLTLVTDSILSGQ